MKGYTVSYLDQIALVQNSPGLLYLNLFEYARLCSYFVIHLFIYLQPNKIDEVFDLLLNSMEFESKFAVRKVCCTVHVTIM